MCDIYVLRLYEEKYYVGRSGNVNNRIDDHFGDDDSKKAAWTIRYKPISVVEIFMNCDAFDEDKYVLKYMEKYGIENVRGGTFSQLVLSQNEISIINKMIKGATDECYNCGSKEHFVNECDLIITEEKKYGIGRFFNCLIKCIESLTSDKSKSAKPKLHKYVCFRCGRNTHFANSCFAKYHLNGKKI